MNKSCLLFAAGIIVFLPRASFATVIELTNSGAFNSLGTIAYDSNFNDFGASFGFPGNPFTRGDVTYNSSENLTWGNQTVYSTLPDTLIGNNNWTPILGSIATAPQYDMFGFDIGQYHGSPITFTLTTNLSAYVFPSETIANSAAGNMDFRGFVSSPGEEFTGFTISADNGTGNLPGITNVEVGNIGNTTGVPEPPPIALLLAGLATVWTVRRRIQPAA